MPWGAPTAAPSGGAASASPLLYQDLDDHYRASAGGQAVEGRRAPGWLRVSGPRGCMTVAVRDFWQLYPKSLSADARARR